MSDTKDKETKQDEQKEGKKTLSLGGTLSLKGAPKPASGSAGSAPPSRHSVAPGRGSGKTVAVEVRRRRAASAAADKAADDHHELTESERKARERALKAAEENRDKTSKMPPPPPRKTEEPKSTVEEASPDATDDKLDAKTARERELEELRQIEEEERRQQEAAMPVPDPQHHQARPKKDIFDADAKEEESYRERMKRNEQRRPSRNPADRRRTGKLTVTQVLNEDYEKDRGPSMAAQRRAREKARMAAKAKMPDKIVREIVVPETITVQELANRMAERGGDVIKALMNMGVMATINEVIDADTAELLVDEFGHKIKRVTEADVEVGLEGTEDEPERLTPRPPVVTIMGHVDHGKTSLLDALRTTDVVSGEAGGITQHIGAYQITMPKGDKITFLDTPGHAAFTQMRARGANITDIVVLVVAANDGIMPQTIEAINHAKAAGVPIIVAINKIDLPDANPMKIKQDLLQHEVVLEDMGGDVMSVEVSALKKQNLDALEELILLQAEILELKANPDRNADGTVVEARLEQGRGHVATVLVERGTLKIGDIFVIGAEWGRVRALVDDHGQQVKEAIPGQPIEILGLNGPAEAGDKLVVLEGESRAREIAEYRQRKRRETSNVRVKSVTTEDGTEGAIGVLDQLLATARSEEARKLLNVVIKADVHGSVEAITGSLAKIEEENPDVRIRVLHSGAGGITESDVTLANASDAIIIGFNVRANPAARELAEREKADIRYYNIIYNIIDDVKNILSGLLDPTLREEYLGQAEIREVFKVSKVGMIAGCMVTKGSVKRGSKVRLLRDDVVIHEGTLKTLKRFKDEVKEVKEGMECGMAFEKYEDIKVGDIIECFDVIEEARSLT